MLVFSKIKLINSLNLYNLIYYLMTSYLLRKPTNNRTRQNMQQNLMKFIKVQKG